ncbi:MAG TPA: hypothetical protein VEP49_19060, partial [Acidimicrobiia bacterium]|nr:hypothetical protein [Acidimicrobiia bacterium]
MDTPATCIFPSLRRGVVLAAVAALALAGLFALPAARAGATTCTKSWAAAVDGNWSDGSKWTGGTAPTSTDDVCITADSASYTVTLDVDVSIDSLQLGGSANSQTLDLEAHALDLAADSSLSAQGVLSLGDGSALDLGSHTLHNAGTLQTVTGPCTATLTNGTLDNTGSLTIGCTTADLFGLLGATNTGTVTIAAGGSWSLHTLTNSAGTITNDGALAAGDYTQGNGAVTNNPVDASHTITLTGTGAAHMRATGGGVSLTGSPLTIDQSLDIDTTVLLSNDLTNQGTITLGSHILDLRGHTLHNTGSLQTVTGPCTATLTNGTLDNTGTLTISCTTSDLFGALGATNTGTVTIAAGGSWSLHTLTNSAGTITNDGAL